MPTLLRIAVLAALVGASPAFAAGDFPGTKIGIHAVNLLIILGVLGYFVRRPVADALANRRAEIRRGIEAAEQARAAARARAAAIEARLGAIESEVGQLRAEAEVEATREAEVIARRAAVDVAAVDAAATRAIQDELARARAALRAEAATLAVGLAGELASRNIAEGDHARLTQSFVTTVTEGRTHG